MDFAFSEEQKMLRDSARDFLKSECPKTMVGELEESDPGYSPKLWKKMAQLDWMSIIVPEAYDGMGWGLLDMAVLFEEFGRAAMPGPMFATVMGTLAILEGGTEAQKQKFLPHVVSGKLILTLAMEEPDAVYDPKFVGVRATGNNDRYTINGTKLFVPYAHVANYLVVVTRTAGDPGDEKGITVFVVDAKSPGIRLTPIKTIAADKQFQVDFEDVAVSSDDVIGDLNNGISMVRAVLEKAAAIQCAEAAGGAQQELDMTAKYTKEREQFGRPIGTFQAVQHRLADMYIDARAARWTTYQAVWRLGEGLPAGRELAIAKAITSKACQRVAFSAQQLHGGIGVDLDYDLHFYYRRAKAFELKFGSPSFHLEALGAEI